MRRLLTFTLATLTFLSCAIWAQDSERPPAVGHYALRADPVSLDPQAAYDSESISVIGAIYDTLLEYHPTKTDPYTLRPCILKALPKKEVSPDGRHSYVCEIKAGVRFHDDPCFPGGKGREVTASDVQYTFQRICDPAVDSPFFGPLAEVVAGMAEARAEAAKQAGTSDYSRAKFSGVEVLDARRFRIHLRKPSPQLAYWLASPCTAPVAREAVELYHRDATKRRQSGVGELHPVGTGAFRLSKHVPQQRIHLTRVAGYATTVFPDDADTLKHLAGKPLPLLDEVEFTISRDNLPLLDAFRMGALDAMPINKDARDAMLDSAGQLMPKFRERGAQLHWQQEPSTFFFAFNLDDAAVGKNKKLRQAISCAFDSRAFSTRFENAIPATQLLPPGIFGHEPGHQNPYGFDPEKAKRLLAEAGYPGGRNPNGESLEISITTSGTDRASEDQAEFHRHAIESLGIKVKLERVKFAELFARKGEGKFQIAVGSGWGADYPDAENFFMLFHGANIPPQGQNASRYRNAEYDRVFEKMAQMEDSPARADLIRGLDGMLAEDCPVVLTTHKRFRVVSQPWAPITHQNPFLYGGFKYLTVDPMMRARLLKEWEAKER